MSTQMRRRQSHREDLRCLPQATAFRRSTGNWSATQRDLDGPGRTLGGRTNIQRGQLKPRTLTLRTSHFPDPPTVTIRPATLRGN
jgi:hypothetical protein